MSAIITHFAQGATAGSSPGTLYLITSGALRPVRVIRFEWLSSAQYGAMSDPAGTTLYIINGSAARGRGTAHRWPQAAIGATGFRLGGTVVSSVSVGG